MVVVFVAETWFFQSLNLLWIASISEIMHCGRRVSSRFQTVSVGRERRVMGRLTMSTFFMVLPLSRDGCKSGSILVHRPWQRGTGCQGVHRGESTMV